MGTTTQPVDLQGIGLLDALDRSFVTSEHLAMVRQWMDDAPNHPPTATMATWGLLAHALCQAALGTQTEAGDTLRVAAYLDAVGRVDESVFWLSGGRKAYPDGGGDYQLSTEYPVYQALFTALVGLGQFGLERSHPMLVRLTRDIAWKPLPLIEMLHHSLYRQVQEADLMAQFGGGPGLRVETGLARLLYALRPLVLDTSWRPPDHRFFANALRVHDGARAKNADGVQARNTLFVKRWMQACMSSGSVRAIFQMGADSGRTLPQDVPLFFPLAFEQAPALEVVQELVRMHGARTQLPADAREAMEDAFIEHHPHVWNMLSTHAMIFPDGTAAYNNADVLLEGFVRLCTHSTFPSDVSPQLFEEEPL